jgi:hypothetical protein
MKQLVYTGNINIIKQYLTVKKADRKEIN